MLPRVVGRGEPGGIIGIDNDVQPTGKVELRGRCPFDAKEFVSEIFVVAVALLVA